MDVIHQECELTLGKRGIPSRLISPSSHHRQSTSALSALDVTSVVSTTNDCQLAWELSDARTQSSPLNNQEDSGLLVSVQSSDAHVRSSFSAQTARCLTRIGSVLSNRVVSHHQSQYGGLQFSIHGLPASATTILRAHDCKCSNWADRVQVHVSQHHLLQESACKHSEPKDTIA